MVSQNGVGVGDENGIDWTELSPPLPVHKYAEKADNEFGRRAIAFGDAPHNGKRQYLVVTRSEDAVLGHSKLRFD